MKSPLNFIYDENTTIYTNPLPECTLFLKPGAGRWCCFILYWQSI